MSTENIFALSRRNFFGYIALGTFGLLTKDLLYPGIARADSNTADKPVNIKERYRIYVPFTIARNGGKQTFTLRSGELCQVDIPAKIQNNDEITIPGRGENGKEIYVVLHTLYDQKTRIAHRIYQEINSTEFLQASSKDKCELVYYNQVKNGEYIDDVSALDLLDYVISSSKLDNTIKERYELASINLRLLGIQQAIESSLAKSKLNEAEKKSIRGTFAYVRAGEPIPNFKALTELDSIVTSSTLPLEIKQVYSLASAQSRGLAVDFIIVKEIKNSQKLTNDQKDNYLSTYQQVRDGKTVKDKASLNLLDRFISNANIPDNAKVVYLIARKQDLNNKYELAEQADALEQLAQQFKDQLKDAKNKGSVIVPQATKLLTSLGVETATGVSISSLSGAAATNATLAVLGGGSVAAGGFGMLGGLAVATGGAALIGAAGIISIALVSEMDSTDQKNLGIAIGAGTLTSAATVLAAWTAASALGVSGTLSGAAAITATISALGGLSVITGGAALLASGTAFVIWSLLQNGKKRDASFLHQLETRTYTYTEDKISGDLEEFLQRNIKPKYNFEEGFSVPNIPLDKLSKALYSWISVNHDEKIIALIDSSIFDDGKEGIAFTSRKITWKMIFLGANLIDYETLAKFVKKDTKFASLLSEKNQQQELSKLQKLVNILSDSEYSTNLSKLQELVTLTSKDKKLAEIVSNETYRNKVTQLKKAVDILSDNKDNKNWLKLQEVVDILYYDPDLMQFFPSEILAQISNKEYQQGLAKLRELVNMLYYEDDKDNLTKMLREIGQKYSTV